MSKNYQKSLQEYNDFLQKISGANSTSASNTDFWFLTSANQELVFKIVLNEKTGKIKLKNAVLEYGPEEMSVKYEADIYVQIINKILKNNINPFFIKAEGVFEGVKFKQMIEFSDKFGIEKDKFTDRMIRNTMFMSLKDRYGGNMLYNRPSIEITKKFQRVSVTEIYNMLKTRQDDLYYNIIATKKVNGQTFTKYLGYNRKLNKVVWSIIIQVLTALATLEIIKCAHNDLHSGNLLVGEFKTPKYKYFKYDEGEFVLKSNLEAKIYDWDRSYASQLGNNPLLSDAVSQLGDYGSQYNEYTPQRELFKFLFYVIDTLKQKKEKNLLLEFIIPDKKLRDKFIADCDFHHFLLCNMDKAITREMYIKYGFSTPTKMLTEVVKYVSKDKNLTDLIYTIEDDIDRECIDTDPHIEKYDFTSDRVRRVFN
jgi:hypothetical protein